MIVCVSRAPDGVAPVRFANGREFLVRAMPAGAAKVAADAYCNIQRLGSQKHEIPRRSRLRCSSMYYIPVAMTGAAWSSIADPE